MPRLDSGSIKILAAADATATSSEVDVSKYDNVTITLTGADTPNIAVVPQIAVVTPDGDVWAGSAATSTVNGSLVASTTGFTIADTTPVIIELNVQGKDKARLSITVTSGTITAYLKGYTND